MSRDVTIVLKAVDQYSSTLDSFNQKVGGISTTTGQLETATKGTSSALDGMATAVKGTIAAYAGWKGAQLVGDMLDLGQNVGKTTQTFEALTRPLGNSQSIMTELRSSTGGVVDNLTLMQGANRLVQMGLAGSSSELSKLSEMAIKLGSSMGMDATKAMSDFSLMLANNSIMRLDQFGISSGRVRQRMEELKESFPDMDKSERFKLAVLAEGAAALDRLGSAADAASTPLARLGVQMQNLGQDFSSRFATGANGVVGILQIATGTYPGQAEAQASAQQRAALDAQAFAKEYFGDFREYVDAAAHTEASNDFLSQLLFKTMEAQKLDPNLNIQQFISDQIFNAPESANVARYDTEAYVDGVLLALDDANNQVATEAAKKQEALRTQLLNDFLAGDTGREYSPGVDYMGGLYNSYLASGGGDDRQSSLAQQREMLAIQARRQSAFGGLNSAMTGAFGSLGFDTQFADMSLFQSKLSPDYIKSLVPHFMEQSGADAVTQDLQRAQAEFEKLQQLADEKLISDDQLQGAQNMVDNLTAMANESQKAADNFKNMKLEDVFGQTSGGMQGQMTDLVIQKMKDSGATGAQIAAMQAELDKTSGRETESSEELKNQVVPLMAKMSAKQAAQAMVNLDAMFKEAALQGLTQEQIASLMPDIAKKGAAGADMSQNMDQYINMMLGNNENIAGQGTRDAHFGDDEKSMNKRGKGGTITDMSTSFQAISKDSAATDKSMKNIQDSTTAAAKASAEIKEAFDHLKTQHEIKFSFLADDPMGILGLVKQLMGGSSLGEIVRNNGGKVPGATGSGRTASANAN